MSTTSPNMNLVIPTEGGDFSPNYALEINQSLTILDSHNHTPGSGVQITPAAININAALTFNNNQLLALNQAVFTAQASASTTVQSLYVAPGGAENDLFFTDSLGNQIQITKAGVVNSTASSIPGESYSGGTFIWTQTQSSLPTTPANFDFGSITVRPNTAGTTNGIQISPPTGISSAYSLILPALPVSQHIMTLDNSGNITAPYTVDNSTIVINSNVIEVGTGGITATQIANNTITSSQISASANIAGSQLSSSAGITSGQLNSGSLVSTSVSSGSTTSTTFQNVGFILTLNTVAGRPVIFNFSGSNFSTTPAAGQSISVVTAASSALVIIQNITTGIIVTGQIELYNDLSTTKHFPPSVLNQSVIADHTGSSTYEVLFAMATSGTGGVSVANINARAITF